jgi:hypothetical protein
MFQNLWRHILEDGGNIYAWLQRVCASAFLLLQCYNRKEKCAGDRSVSLCS